MNYYINEVFETIQGEATFTGTPSIFIRLQGCPVGCSWCDTKHTWETNKEDMVSINTVFAKDSDSSLFAETSSSDIFENIKHFNSRHVVITGGEPCLYNLTDLTNYLINKGYSVQIETSGTHEVLCNDSTWVTVSPKVNMAGGFKILPSAMFRANEIKHPIGRQTDVTNLIELIYKFNIQCPVWLQPLSQSKKATKLCVKTATDNGFKISIQTHKFIGVR